MNMISLAEFNRKHANLPNALSVLRGLIGLVLPLLLLMRPSPVLHAAAVFLFIFGAITDYWDGWLARKQGVVSNFGKILDPTSDKILILCPLAAFAMLGIFSNWWLVPVFFREIVITFFRLGWLLEGKAAGAERLGKIKLVVQVVTVFFAFLELLTRSYSALSEYQQIAHVLTFVFLIVMNLITVISGITFLISNRALFLSPFFAKFVSAAGVGLLPGPTGTWGSLAALFLLPLISWHPGLFWGVFLFCFAASYWAVNRLDLSREKDPHFVVMDEVLGMWLTLAAVSLSPLKLLAGFFLFRILDIVKPFPCRQMEKLPGFWGIFMDDLGAGIYGWIILYFLFP